MKKTFLIIAIAMNISILNAQNAEWTKDDRNNVYQECMNSLVIYNSLSVEQKESISLCYLNEITQQFSKKEYQSKIEVELKRIRETTISQCAKNIGVSLEVSSTQNQNTQGLPTKENLTGHWRDDNSEFWLFETGDFKMIFDSGATEMGSWKVDGNLLTFSTSGVFSTHEQNYKVLLFTDDKFVYQTIDKYQETFTAIKLK